jgi:PAS domain S-box-containing protein
MAVKLKILFVEDVKTDAELISWEMERNNIFFSKILVDNREDYLDSIKNFEPDLIISDYSLPHFDGMTALLLRNELAPFIPFILVTGSVNEEVAVECMKSGADDYILKDNLSRLGPAIINSIKKSKLAREKEIAEEELRNSEMMLQKAQTIAHIGNWVLDLSLKTMWGSDEASRIYGLVQETHEISYEHAKNIPLPEYRSMLDEALDRLLKYNEPYEIEFKIRRENDGAIRSLYSKAELVLEPDNEKIKVVGIVQDITDRKNAENALKESENKYRNIFENVQDVFYETSIDGTILDVSPSIEKVSQGLYHRKDLIGKSMYEFYTDPEMRISILSELEKNGSVSDFEITLGDLNEFYIYCSVSAKISIDANGLPEKIIGTLRDITDRKKSEEAIEQERRMLRTLIDNLPDPIYVQDKECRKVIANRADVENIGCNDEAEVLGKTDLELFPGKIGERGYADDKKIITTGMPVYDLEEEFISAKGVKRWLLTTKIPLHDKDGNITGLVGIGHDTTERKQIVEELIMAKEKAEESDKLKTAFLHNISHEIRTPMNAIVGFSALLGEPDVDEQTRNSYIEVITQSSNHLLSIITDIVDISNIEANLIKIVKSELNINSALNSLCVQFLLKASKKNVKMECDTLLADSDSLVMTDSTKLIEILSNLISNAVKFTDKGFIKLSCNRKNDFLEFCISDTGIGISPQFHEKIFDRFYQVQNNVSRLYEGTGLGLSISKAYVELLGGKIWLSSEPGNGTKFFFTIPYERARVEQDQVIEKKASDNFIFPVKKVILVAEDVESNFKLIRYFLAGSNAEVLHAYNGKEAVEKCFAEKNIDLILMDIKMPVMDGYTAVKLIRKRNTKIPIIAQTAYADDKDKAIECGCSGFISKPFDKKSLFKVLSEFI